MENYIKHGTSQRIPPVADNLTRDLQTQTLLIGFGTFGDLESIGRFDATFQQPIAIVKLWGDNSARTQVVHEKLLTFIAGV